MQFFRRLSKQTCLWREFLLFRWRNAWLSATLPPPLRGEVLLVSFTDWAPRLLMEGVIAKALALRGYTPVVLTNSVYRWAERYFRACGVQQFLFFDHLLERAARDFPRETVERLLREHSSFQDLYNFSWKGVGVGRHVLSTIARQLQSGSVTFADREVQCLLRRFFPLSLQAVEAARALYGQRQPKAVLFLEKGYTPYGELFDAALLKKLNVIQYFHGQRSDLLVLRRFTWDHRFDHPFSLSKRSWERVRALPWTAAEEVAFLEELKESYAAGSWFNRKFLLQGKKQKTPGAVRAQLTLDPRKKAAVIFSHVLWDATFFFGENLFADYEQWLIATVKAACENPRVHWLIKLHPDYVWKMQQMGVKTAPRDILALDAQIGALPAHVQVVPPDTDISTYSFFAVTDYCITVRGTIGIEAPCFGIPVLTAGTGRYAGLGFTNDSQTQQEYLSKLRHIEDIPPLTPEQTTLACKHAYTLFRLRTLPFRTCEVAPRRDAQGIFDHEAIIRVRSLEELAQASDMNAFLDWVLDSREEDYLHLPS